MYTSSASIDHCYNLNRMVSIMVTESGLQKECPGGSGSNVQFRFA